MMMIGICDNDPVFSDNLCKMIRHAMTMTDDWDICVFQNGRTLKEAIETDMFNCELLFIDIMIDNGTGPALAQYICQHTSHTDLIFVTASDRYVYEGYRYHAFAYLLKPVSEKEVVTELRRYVQEKQHADRSLTIRYQGIKHHIPVSSILYIESNLRKVTIHTQHGSYYCYQKLNDMAEQLKEDGFIRCHQSYLFALDKVTNYSNIHVYIQNTPLPISKRYQNEIRELFSQLPPASLEGQTLPLSFGQPDTDCGTLICICGAYLGSIVRIHPEQKITIGRDEEIADLVINLPLVSRKHCTLIYHCDIMKYEIVDLSTNGTFVDGNKQLVKNESYLLRPGSEICFGDKDTVYKLG